MRAHLWNLRDHRYRCRVFRQLDGLLVHTLHVRASGRTFTVDALSARRSRWTSGTFLDEETFWTIRTASSACVGKDLHSGNHHQRVGQKTSCSGDSFKSHGPYSSTWDNTKSMTRYTQSIYSWIRHHIRDNVLLGWGSATHDLFFSSGDSTKPMTDIHYFNYSLKTTSCSGDSSPSLDLHNRVQTKGSPWQENTQIITCRIRQHTRETSCTGRSFTIWVCTNRVHIVRRQSQEIRNRSLQLQNAVKRILEKLWDAMREHSPPFWWGEKMMELVSINRGIFFSVFSSNLYYFKQIDDCW